ncbi:MAG TPA: transporter [Sphingobium sp.]|uniref:OmpP1/FadL family transporter n=1 Tax=unclassified Sphingobium TaxID=2611147 RepID=UPI0007F3AD31|nr:MULTISPECIES: outer membrane protein transport protein [unclassified Sphingobium]OAN50991.1 long-chain fatty acid transporter [Sphingobium sp. TCM1]WIW88124.1 outer membrane protein transport protein [Sphingobium sp. V4]HAF40301.1 transporter [Sphingobium sp.]
MSLSRRLGCFLLVTGAMTASSPALAGGFYLQEQSPIETGRALSGGAAAADDPSTIYFNPAAMTQLSGIQTSVGGSLLMASAHQTNRGSYRSIPGSTVRVPVTGNDGGNAFESVIPVPSFYASAQVSDRLWLGLGVNAPFGLKLEYDDGFFGRYDSLYTDLKTYNIQPSAAYKLTDSLSIGGGVDVQYVKAELTNALPQLSPLATTDGFASLKGDDWSVGWNAGLFYTSGDTNVGVHYRAGITHKLAGTQSISGLTGLLAGANGAFAATAPLSLPDIVTVSMMHRLTPGLRAMITGKWYNWSKFKGIAVTTASGTTNKELDYRDSYSVSVGGEYDVSPALTLRAGTMFDRSPTNAQHLTTRVPDGDRVWLSGGGTWNMSESMALNLSYAHTFVAKANIIRPDSYYPSPATVTATTLSQTSGNADQIAASLTLRF